MNEEKLRLDLQFFSDENADDGVDDIEIERPEGAENIEEESEKQEDEKKFTQADVDRIIGEKLARDRKKREEDAERKRLEEQGEYKELLDKANEEIAALKAEKAKAERSKTINEQLLAKGVKAEDVSRYARYVERLVDTDEDIPQAVQDVYNDFIKATQDGYGDPTADFTRRKEREQKDDADLGKELFSSLKR